jgi:uncharacterized membrane protein YbhN (UPF0104 family)
MAPSHLLRLLPGFVSRRSLAARGQFLNTFAGLAFCVALALLTLGGYLVEQQFANPVQDQSTALLFAALLIATATTLLYFLLHSSRRLRHRVSVASVPRLWEENPLVVARGNTGARSQDGAEVSSHGRFVDRTVIRIQR